MPSGIFAGALPRRSVSPGMRFRLLSVFGLDLGQFMVLWIASASSLVNIWGDRLSDFLIRFVYAFVYFHSFIPIPF
jgi:hypothetical protein